MSLNDWLMVRFFLLIAFTHFTINNLHGQDTPAFHPPVKIPMYLSGNFGEIRSDHFHSGIDIKTQGITGHELFSIEQGFVSRIKVQANGYGKSIYITHPDGHTSVYGHLDRYRDDFAEFVKGVQYHRRSHTVDIYPEEGRFRLGKGELIGYSGNTGSSSGPHLHFEVRTTGNQHPTNVLRHGFNITDRVAPRFFSLHIYPAGRDSRVNGSSLKYSKAVVPDRGIYTIPYGTRIVASGTIGFGAEVFDYLDGSSNRCGIYTLELFVDDALKFRARMDEFSFSETRYVNAHIDYGEKQLSGTTVQRLYRLPNDRSRIYDYLEGNGQLEITAERDYQVRIVATDVAGNRSELAFSLSGKAEGSSASSESPGSAVSKGKIGPEERITWNEPHRFEMNGLEINIPAGALYDDLEFICSTVAQNGEFLSPLYQVGSAEVPLHLPYTLSIIAQGIDASLHDRLLLVTPDPRNGLKAAGGAYRDGRVVASLRAFGQYAIGLDTIAPEITPVGGPVRGDLSGHRSIRFNITDDLSGISKYEAFIDNRWALFEYDPKNDLLIYTFDETRIGKGRMHELELYVSDGKGNVNLFHTTFTW